MKEVLELILQEIKRTNRITKYENSFEKIQQQKTIESNCNAIAFVSPTTNTAEVLINGWPLAVGTTLNLNGNTNEIDKTKYKVDMPFGNQTILIIRKINYL